MDKIWDWNPSKSDVIGHCGGDETNEWSRRTDKSRTLKKTTVLMVLFSCTGQWWCYIILLTG